MHYCIYHLPVTKMGMPTLWATSIVPETVVPPLSLYTINTYQSEITFSIYINLENNRTWLRT